MKHKIKSQLFRTTVFITEYQKEKLDEITKNRGTKFGELIRRAVDKFIEKEGK